MDEKWAVFGSEDTTAIWVEDESGKRVCTLRNCETDLDRANLIAAAPETAAERDRLQAINAELVEALAEAEEILEDGHWQETKRRFQSLIAKAKES